MFREMRRKQQTLPREECEEILARATSGVLAASGDGGYPYAVPLGFVYSSGRIYFHCAATGHKLDAIAACDKVSFCVIAQDDVDPQAYTTRFKSVIAFGRARLLTDPAEKRAALVRLAEKYAPGDEAGREREIACSFDRLVMVEIAVEHLTGKEAIELTRARGTKQ